MNPEPKFDLHEGKLRVTVGGFTMLEPEWLALCDKIDAFMSPVREARFEAKKAAERAEFDARMLAHQSVELIDGVAFRAQRHPDHGRVTTLWLDGETMQTSPFLVQVDSLGAPARPWKIMGRVTRMRHDGWGIRNELCGEPSARCRHGGPPLRFGTFQAAAKKALALELHKSPISELTTA